MGHCGNCVFRASDEDPAGFREPRPGCEPRFSDLQYAIAKVVVPSPAAVVEGGRDVKSKMAMRIPLRIPCLTNDMSLDTGARLLVQGNMPAEWAHTQDDTATEEDAA